MMQQPELPRARHRLEDSQGVVVPQPVTDVSVGGPLRKKTRIERTMEQKQVRRERKKAKQHNKQAWQTLTSSGSSSGILTVKVEAPEVVSTFATLLGMLTDDISCIIESFIGRKAASYRAP